MAERLKTFRNDVALVYAWLILVSLAVALICGNQAIHIRFLIATFLFSMIVVILFMLAFDEGILQKKSFKYRLTLFMILIFY